MPKSKKKRYPSYGYGGSVTDQKEQAAIKQAQEEAKKASAAKLSPIPAGTGYKLSPSNPNVYHDANGNYITNNDPNKPKYPVEIDPVTGRPVVKKIYAKGGKIKQTFDSFMRGK